MGAPFKFSSTMPKRVKKYLATCTDTEEEVVKSQSEKSTTYEQKFRVKIPTIEGLAVFLKISKETIYQWERSYPDFAIELQTLRANQADRLINEGLAGRYNPTIAKVLLTKHDYREGIAHGGDDDAPPIRHDVSKLLDKSYGDIGEVHTNS